MKNTGLHHVSVLSSDVKKAYGFYHSILGLKLILKTVSQDDPNMYHLFFGDETGRGGTEFTIFEMKNYKYKKFGTNSIERTMFLVPTEESIYYWENRLNKYNVLNYGIEIYNDKKILRFEDEDGQNLGFVYKDNINLDKMNPYVADDIPKEHSILGIGDIYLRVRYTEPTQKIIEEFFGFVKYNEIIKNNLKISLFKFYDNDFKHEIHIIEDKNSSLEDLGIGGVHHISFGVETIEDLEYLQQKLEEKNFVNSNIVDREFIISSYFREANNILFEVATPLSKDKKEFPLQNQNFDEITLYLPKFLEKNRKEIEFNVNYQF